MPRKRFVPRDFQAPQHVNVGNYELVPITTHDVDEDLQTLLANADMIIQQRGGEIVPDKWPYKFTRDENFIDLAWLESCAKNGQLFSYILRNKNDNSYAGCVYIYPIELYYPELAEKYDVYFSFWITKQEYERDVYERVFKDLLNSLKNDWPFVPEKIYLRNREIPPSLRHSA